MQRSVLLFLLPGRRWLGLLLLLLTALPALAQPGISSFSPTSGAAGSNVVITGSGFTGATSVRFGELSAVFTVNSASQITAVVPRAASTQLINVTTSAGYSFSSAKFTVTRSSSVTYGQVSSSFAGVSGGTNAAPAVADIDGDGLLDLLVGLGDGTISRYEQTSVNGTAFTALGSLRTSGNAIIDVGTQAAVAIVDFEGNGRFNLVLGRGDGTVSEYEQTSVGAGTFDLVTDNLSGISTTSNVVPGMTDLDGDGYLELLTGKGDGIISHSAQSFVNTDNLYRIDTNFNYLQLSGNAAPFCVDLDGDGLLDILMGVNTGSIYRYEQNATGSYTVSQLSSSFNSISAGTNAKPCVTDIDGDGLLDLLVGRADGTIYRYEQSGTPPAPTITGFTPTSGPVGTAVTVTGTNLGAVTAAQVYGTPGTLIGMPTTTSFTFTVGSGSSTGSIGVTSPGGAITSSGVFTVGTANTAPTNLLLSPGNINENMAGVVGVLTTTDAQGGTFTYTLVTGTGSTDNASFSISGGNLSLTTSPNYEVKNSYAVRVRTTDSGGLWYEKAFTVSINNVVETPSITSFSPTSGTVGTSVTINGSQFQNAGAVTVKFNGTTASGVSVSSNSQLTVPVPSGATTGTISVQNADGTATSSGTFTVVQPAPNTTIVSGPPAIGNNSTVSFQFSSDQSPVEYATSGAPNATYTNNGATPTFGPIPDGTYTLSVAARNTSTGLSDQSPATYAFTIDTQAPVPTLGSFATGSTRTSPIPFTVNFGETVTGFALSDLTVTGGTASNLSGNGSLYSFSVTPTASGNPPVTITVALGANKVVDAAGNNNVAATSVSRTFDTQAPTLVISGPGGTTSTSPLSLTATFSEAVLGFQLSDLTLTRGTASNLSGSGTTYTFDVTPSSAGIVTVSAAAGAAQDLAANNSAASNSYSVTYAPPVTVTGITPTATPTNDGTATFTVTFSGSVTGVTAGSFSLTPSGISGATIAGVTGSGSSRTVTVNTGSGDGTLRLDLSNGAGIAPTVSNAPYTSGTPLTVDRTAPVGTVGSGAPSPTRTAPIPYNVTFSEAVTGFALSDLTVTNGTAGSLSVSGNVYSFSITPTANGPVTVQLEASAVTDAAGNANAVSNTISRIYDNQGPVPTLATTAGSATNSTPFAFTLTFPEAVTGFALNDLTVSGGTAGNLTGSGASYTFTIAPSGSGNLPSTVTVSLAGNRVTDAAGNNNVASNSVVVRYDTQVPTATLSSTAPNPTNAAPIPVTVTFSEVVVNFSLADVTVTNGTAGSLSGSGTTYTFSITPAANGAVSVQVNAGAAQDEAGNDNTASATLSRTFDNQGPTVTLSGPAGSSSNVAAFTVTATFSQAVTGFSLSDLSVSGGTASALAGSGASYSFTLTASGSGTPASTVSVSLPANQVVDGASNGNTASNTLSRSFDTQAPTVTLSTTAPANSGTAAFTVTVLFAEPVTGFALTDLSVSGGTASALTGSGASYSFTLTASGSGNPASTVSVTLPANQVVDGASNGNTASNTLSRSFDT
ncbi:Ig-like domain-containing protein, partial [Hymenobacter sp. ASUV-10]